MRIKAGESTSELEMSLLHEQVYRLYFNQGKTQREIAEELEIKRHIIITMFKENEWEARPSAPGREEANPDDVYKLYFQEGLSQRDVAKKLGLSSPSPIKRIFKENEWEPRGRWNKPPTRRHFSTDEERKTASKERYDKWQLELKEMREQLFGTECKMCGTSNEEKTIAIHRKDFTEHRQNKLWIKSELESIDPEEWVALCVPCHRGVHWMHEQHGAEWKDIEQHQKHNNTQISQVKEQYELSDKQKEAKRNGHYEGETIAELRKRLFGKECSMCGSVSRRLAIHRKDSRPHERHFLRSRKNLEALDTDEWKLLCQKCHRYVHWAMDKLQIEWDDFAHISNNICG
jgi:transposase